MGKTYHFENGATVHIDRDVVPIRPPKRNPLHNPVSVKCRCGHVLKSHNQDLPWARCGNTACKHRHCDCERFTPNAPDQRPGAENNKT